MNVKIHFLLIMLSVFTLTACGGGGGGSCAPISTVQISWNSNPETAVNRSGGGYKVYYSSNSGFNLSDVDVTEIDVPFNGSTTPTSTQVQLISGTYYIRIIAFSALNAPGTTTGSSSAATSQITLIVC